MILLGYVAISVIGIVLLEISTGALIKYLRAHFQWLITGADENPRLDKDALEKFFNSSYDHELGWVRRPNTTGHEKSRSGDTSFEIGPDGSRVTPNFKMLPASISCYGDSFTFCRQVNDDETWPYFLSGKIGSRIQNFGVGNYGMDQALLRLKREYPQNPTPVVVLAIVPETITRVLSVWKHYSEYGNTFAFKPRFFLRNNHLELFSNLADKPEKYFELETLLPSARKNDEFYLSKFRKDILTFPYLISFTRSIRRSLPLITALCLKHIYKAFDIYSNYEAALFKKFVLNRNIALSAKLYRKIENENLLIAILRGFVEFCTAQGAKPIFMMLPQLTDIEYIVDTEDYYYEKFMKRACEMLPCLDLAPQVLALEKHSQFYSDDRYGGHFNKHGNALVADTLFDFLQSLELSELTIHQNQDGTA
ncbi:MAG: hypothetical protein CMM52_16515 [Rhodospirillaceae bacterium]|nr:hypothetical protein [Rhodospirillaceae bacterium]|tara:strand:- start:1729 stop:2994 length:1266 start_codon:yes stop_codon:yes gene_type:complete